MLKRPHRIAPPVYWLLGGAIAWGLAWLAPLVTWHFPGQFLVSLSLALLGAVILASSFRLFRRADTSPNPLSFEGNRVLLTQGLYRWSRNPIYLGMLLVLLAVCLWLGALSSLVGALFFYERVTRTAIKPEEIFLQSAFGKAYSDYQSTVRRWL